MAKIVWDRAGERFYETGTDHGVLYPVATGGKYGAGVPWNGLTAVTESPSGAEPTSLYADNIKYLTMMSAEEFGATLEAYTYPPEFEQCDGTIAIAKGVTIGQQERRGFGLSYRTRVGNDLEGDDYGYKLHLVYGCKASPSEKSYATKNDSPEAITFSWSLTTTPVSMDGMEPTATITIDSRYANATDLASLENILYGDESNEPRLPMPDEVATIMTTTKEPVDVTDVTVAALEGSESVLGKQASELGSNVTVAGDGITGTLTKVSGFTMYSSESGEQEGNYLAFKVTKLPKDTTATAVVTGGKKAAQSVAVNTPMCFRVSDKTSQKLEITVTNKDQSTGKKTYNLSGLTLGV